MLRGTHTPGRQIWKCHEMHQRSEGNNLFRLPFQSFTCGQPWSVEQGRGGGGSGGSTVSTHTSRPPSHTPEHPQHIHSTHHVIISISSEQAANQIKASSLPAIGYYLPVHDWRNRRHMSTMAVGRGRARAGNNCGRGSRDGDHMGGDTGTCLHPC